MPFGLKGAPATFQRRMIYVLTELQGTKCLVYRDDIIVHGTNLSKYNKNLTDVFNRIRENKLKL